MIEPMRNLVGSLLLVTSLTLSAHGQSEPLRPDRVPDASADAERRARYQRGRLYVEAKNWQEAQRVFSQLWKDRQTYDVALMLGQVEVNLGLFRDAAEHLDFGLRHLAPREDPKTVARARRLLEVVKGRVATLEVRSNRPGAEIAVDGTSVGEAPLSAELYLEPGSYEVQASSQSDRVRRQVQAEAGSRHVVDLKFDSPAVESGLEPGAPPSNASGAGSASADAHATGAGKLNWIPVYVGAALTTVGMGAGIGFGIAANAAKNDLEDFTQRFGSSACQDGTATPSECGDARAARDRQQSNATRSTVAFAAAGGVAAVTVLYTLLWPRRDRSFEHASRSPLPNLAFSLDSQSAALAISADF